MASSVSFATCPLAPMPELVRDDDLHGAGSAASQQRVEDDDAARAADAGDVRVHLGRAAAGIGDEHVPHRDTGSLRELAQARRERLVVERPEAVEEGLEDDRSDEREQEHGQRERSAGGHRPPARQRPRKRNGRRPRRRSEHDRHGQALGAIAEPAADPLRGETPARSRHQPRQQRERCPDEAREHRDERGVCSCSGHRRERVERGEEPVSERAPRQGREQAGGERQVGQQREIERPVVVARPLPLVRRESRRSFIRMEGTRVTASGPLLVFTAKKRALHLGRKEGRGCCC